jgi:hypothetical protein
LSTLADLDCGAMMLFELFVLKLELGEPVLISPLLAQMVKHSISANMFAYLTNPGGLAVV